MTATKKVYTLRRLHDSAGLTGEICHAIWLDPETDIVHFIPEGRPRLNAIMRVMNGDKSYKTKRISTILSEGKRCGAFHYADI